MQFEFELEYGPVRLFIEHRASFTELSRIPSQAGVVLKQYFIAGGN